MCVCVGGSVCNFRYFFSSARAVKGRDPSRARNSDLQRSCVVAGVSQLRIRIPGRCQSNLPFCHGLAYLSLTTQLATGALRLRKP